MESWRERGKKGIEKKGIEKKRDRMEHILSVAIDTLSPLVLVLVASTRDVDELFSRHGTTFADFMAAFGTMRHPGEMNCKDWSLRCFYSATVGL
jgi:hypothetical protein